MAAQHERAEGTVIWLDSARRGRVARPPRTTTVVIACGRSLIRAGMRMLLEMDEQITVVGETASAGDVLRLAQRERPDVILVDPDDGELADGAWEHISPLAATGAAVMLLTEPRTEDELHAALRAGARGVLPFTAGPAELSRAVRVLARGDAVLSPAATRRLLAAFASTSPTP
jgi:DNA-binding NarL/FixJ family response regulator